jgi:hypothetical protein
MSFKYLAKVARCEGVTSLVSADGVALGLAPVFADSRSTTVARCELTTWADEAQKDQEHQSGYQ